MIRLTISEIDSESIAEAIDDPTIDDRTTKKLMAIRMHELDVPAGNIAKFLNVSDDTITNYLKLYQGQGLKGILENRYYQPSSQVEPFMDEIRLLKRICGSALVQEVFQVSEIEPVPVLHRF